MAQTVLGPGTLTLGEVATAIDLSCLVNAMVVAFEKDQGDSQTKLCGDEFPGAVTYTASLTGNVDQDPGDATGLLATSWANPGQVVKFTFTPNTANGTAAAGELVLDPLDFGGETYGEIMQSDVEWTCVGTLTLTSGGGATRTLNLGQPVLPPARKRSAPIAQTTILAAEPVDEPAPTKAKAKASA